MPSEGVTPASNLPSILDAFDERLPELLRQSRWERHGPGSTLFREGTEPRSIMQIRRGRVKITCLAPTGRETLLAIRGRGDLLGELGVLDQQPRSATVTALDEVEVMVVPANAFRALLERDGRLALRVLSIVSSRLREADRRRAEFGAVDTPTRLALRLLEQAHRYSAPEEDGTYTALSLTQDELAGWVGSSREAVSKALRMFRERGWVETGRRRITILDVEALRRYTDPMSHAGDGE